MKKIIALSLVLVICFSLSACDNSALNGVYVSESGKYSIDFKGDGICTWYQDGAFFNGTYEKTEKGWQLNIAGSGFYGNTVFNAEGDSKSFIVTGGVVLGEVFTKQ